MQLSPNFLFGSSRPSAPRGHRAYIVGDVHGRLDLLEALLGQIEQDVQRRRRLRNTIVFLGDLIDRGPDSAGVVERLRTYRPAFAKTVFLMGNHEEVMLQVLDGRTDLLPQWLSFGGGECVASYGLDPARLKRIAPADAIARIRYHVPAEHVAFLKSFADTITFGSYLFVHAGIRPGTELADQAQFDLRWIREPFLTDERDHGCIVVHGHTIAREIQERPNRIGIDTGAYRTGILTALGIEGTSRWFLQTADDMIQSRARSSMAADPQSPTCGGSV